MHHFPEQPISDVLRLTPTEVNRLVSAKLGADQKAKGPMKFDTMAEAQAYLASRNGEVADD